MCVANLQILFCSKKNVGKSFLATKDFKVVCLFYFYLAIVYLDIKRIIFREKSKIPSFNTYFSTTQHLFRILGLPTQIEMVIVYRKPSSKRII